MASAALEALYGSYYDDPWGAIQRGEKLLAKETDKLGVLEVMHDAVRTILSDLGEHGDANIHDYGNHGKEHWVEVQKAFAKRIKDAKKAGAKSTFFKDKLQEIKVAYGTNIDEFLGKVRLVGKERETLRALRAGWAAYSNQKPIKLVHEAMKKAIALEAGSSKFVDAIAAQCDELLVEWFVSDQKLYLDGAKKLVALYSEFQAKHGHSRGFGEGTIASCIGTANKTGHAKTAKLALALVPREVTFRRLAYKLAQFHAGRREKDEMMKYMARAMELGQDRYDFDDDEFERYVMKDKAVRALLKL